MSVSSPNLPRVDVIIPTYNGLPYLLETIASALGQTHRDVLVWVVDDGSTDDTEGAVKAIGDARVRYLKKPNGGQASARNMGVRASDSAYVAFLDADDLWAPGKLEEQLRIYANNPELGLVYGSHDFIDEKGEPTGGGVEARVRGRALDALLGGNVIAGSASMALVPRAVLDDVGGFREDLLIGEDWEFWLRIAQKHPIDYVDGIMASLRTTPNNMQQNRIKMAKGLEYMLPIMLETLALTREQRRALAGTCQWTAANHYFASGEAWRGRKLMLGYLSANPRVALDHRHWELLARTFIPARVLRITFGTKTEPTWVRTGLQRVKRAAKGRARHAG